MTACCNYKIKLNAINMNLNMKGRKKYLKQLKNYCVIFSKRLEQSTGNNEPLFRE